MMPPFEVPKIEKSPSSKEEEREIISQIENLPLLDLDRMFILLTYFREKPASNLELVI